MKTLIIVFLSAVMSVVATAKPHCQSFNNYDEKVTIVFMDNHAKDGYTVDDVKLIPSSWKGEEYRATSVKIDVITLVFPHITQFSNPTVTLRINGKKAKFKVCQ